jgi:hypothetical protein
MPKRTTNPWAATEALISVLASLGAGFGAINALSGYLSELLGRLIVRRRRGCEERSLAQLVIPWACWVSARWRRLQRPGATITLWIIAAFGATQVLRAEDVPDKEFWTADGFGHWIFDSLAVATTLTSLLLVLGYRRLLKHRGDLKGLERAARGVRTVIERAASLPHQQFGINIWLVTGMRGFRRLERGAIVVARDRATTPILWTKRKGAIGVSWAENRRVVVDLAEMRRDYPNEASWCALPKERRFRFSWREFSDTPRYNAIVAKPIRARVWGTYRVRAVLAVDLAVDGRLRAVETVLESQEVSDILRTCEGILAKGVDD